MKLSKLAIIGALTMLTGCANQVGHHCITMLDNRGITYHDKIKRIAIEEAANNGFEGVGLYVKPTKRNNWTGELKLVHKRSADTDWLSLEFEKNMICFRGIALEAKTKEAVSAIKDRLSHL